MLFFPERTALLGIAIWLILFALAPLHVMYAPDVGAMAFIALCYGAFFLGCAIIAARRSHTAEPILPIDIREERGGLVVNPWLFWGSLVLGTASVALRHIDRVVYRSVDLSLSAVQQREIMQDAAAGPVAAVAGALMPFCYLPLIFLLVSGKGNTSRLQWPPAIVLFFLPMAQAMEILSRSTIIVAASIAVFSFACARFQGGLFHRKLLVPALALIVIVSVGSSAMFTSRLDQLGIDLASSVENSGYAFTLQPDRNVVIDVESGDDALPGFYASVVPNLQYYLHGIFEFSLMWERPDPQPFGYGIIHFAPYAKALQVFTGSEALNTFSSKPFFYRLGVWTGFFGPLWADFGYLSPLFMMLFGMLVKWVAARCRSGSVNLLPLHVYFCGVILFMPVIDLLVSAQGMYIVNGFAIAALATRERRISNMEPAGQHWAGAPIIQERDRSG